MNRRSHAAHSDQSLPQRPQNPSSTSQDSPSNVLHADSDHVRGLLEELDDVIFLAIRGDADSLHQAQQLWPRVVQEIGWDLVEESREQYLRYSTDLARRMESDQPRDPEKALAVIEVIDLLMRD